MSAICTFGSRALGGPRILFGHLPLTELRRPQLYYRHYRPGRPCDRHLELLVAKRTQRRTARLAYSISRLAKESDVSRSMIYEEIAAGRLIARKIGRRTIVRRADALAWLRSLPRLLPGDDDGMT